MRGHHLGPHRVVGVILGALLAQSCTSQPAAPRKSARIVRITAGQPGGGVLAFSVSLADAYRHALRNVTVETKSSDGASANVEAIQRGDADLGFSFADVAYGAFTGLDGDVPYEHLRAIAALQVSPAYLVVAPGSTIRNFGDLKGRRVAIGPRASGGAFRLLLRAYGLSHADLRLEGLPSTVAAGRLVDGTLDAAFLVGGFANEAVRAATRAGARLVPVREPPVDALRQEYPFFKPAMIPKGVYGLTAPLRTIGVGTLLLCRRELDEQLVYDLTRVFFEALPTVSPSQDILRYSDLEQASATPIPLHPGAARYYRERELTH